MVTGAGLATGAKFFSSLFFLFMYKAALLHFFTAKAGIAMFSIEGFAAMFTDFYHVVASFQKIKPRAGYVFDTGLLI